MIAIELTLDSVVGALKVCGVWLFCLCYKYFYIIDVIMSLVLHVCTICNPEWQRNDVYRFVRFRPLHKTGNIKY